ncbi:MAG: cob(I)yrinic acid a,c-diamide adenosyltransferase [Deltaproteobacteria bacterium]|nr:cob(I)yrinic acid a,c-diamide adenosyltransferase [Deltaproteobacteria bacterium]
MSSAIYTRTGDDGSTSLVDGSRVSKTSFRVEAYGTVDEANSWIGAARAFVSDPLLERCLEFVQHRFYNASSNLATPPGCEFAGPGIADEDVIWMEEAIDVFEKRTGALKDFVVPGGCREAGFLHVARTVCRRAERSILKLADQEEVDERVRRFVNRGSDFLFAAARYANVVSEASDVHWDKDLPRPSL